MRTITGKQFVREVSNILEQYLRAVQVASNPRLLDPEWKGTPAKFAELDEIVGEVTTAGQKIVIWTNYLLNVAELRERYAPLGSAELSGNVPIRERQGLITTFQNDPQMRVLVAVPAAGGVGVTLTAATTAVYVERTWNAEHWLQSIDRLHRVGQRGTVSIISLCSGGVDEAIARNLERKTRMQAQVLGDEPIPERVVDSFPSIDDLIAAVQPEGEAANRRGNHDHNLKSPGDILGVHNGGMFPELG
jgi:SNF2 family DNA or RNA helicase